MPLGNTNDPATNMAMKIGLTAILKKDTKI
jgi:hypothetical protein